MAAVAVLCILAMPVQARPNDDDSWFEMKRSKIVKMLKRLGGMVGSLGDGLSDPRP
ncbi:MAG TPA: hypothetical protein VEK57_28635 [Thermoanaerobaculia bacterium]|nr:hypothetical protein [Thermoanaerobaculia bacterium]